MRQHVIPGGVDDARPGSVARRGTRVDFGARARCGRARAYPTSREAFRVSSAPTMRLCACRLSGSRRARGLGRGPAARAAGDAAKDGEWERAAERCVERMQGVCEGTRLSKANRHPASSSRWDIASDTAFREARRVYQEHYATYMAMHAARSAASLRTRLMRWRSWPTVNGW